MIFFDIAYRHNKLALHAAAITYKDKAILLSAPSGTGKSTLANRFLKFNKDCVITNDDKPLIFKKNNQIYTAGSPWSGTHAINKIFLTLLSKKEALVELMRNLYRPKTNKQIDVAHPILETMLDQLAIYEYACIDDDSAYYDLIKLMEYK